ncbi:hypothetical protein C463_01901 [Halorubrum californiense DSM 19288]|uniref:Uncharacterized protein n=1 Tax=Halorubrum californiense DSM 19288 TaxID=1227465 RepID=M0EJR9_9EURY|nr:MULTISPECIES: hypothetical protein [Halorubrum]ELZ48001.1 hypothetical protein C463_01901 [Halorubrum californiense DSM 19288]TKX67436.1 hypothetical protein EXE40_15220 [Halorubrum sp. GN11GM_10-3_MGM]
MTDDKDGREKQAADEDRRQRERDVDAELERGDEAEPPAEGAEPPVDEAAVEALESALEPLTFPATGREIISAVGDRELESPARVYTVADLVPDADMEAFDAPAAVRERVRRPAVAAAMKRVVEAAAELENVDFGRSQHEAFERTFRALSDVDERDDESGVRAVADWVVDLIAETKSVPGSRAVRREAASYCRERGYEIRDDEWLGV